MTDKQAQDKASELWGDGMAMSQVISDGSTAFIVGEWINKEHTKFRYHGVASSWEGAFARATQ